MSNKNRCLAPLALVCALFGASSAQASLTMYTSRAAFAAALSSSATDSYDDLTAGDQLPSTINRSAGTFSYAATAANGLYVAGTDTDGWLGTFFNTDALTLDTFGSGTAGVGGDFFLSDAAGAIAADGNITVTGFDADGSLAQTFSLSSLTNFVGFISSTGTVGSVLVTNNQTGAGVADARFITLNDVTLGTVPEPGTTALVLAALALLPAARRKRV